MIILICIILYISISYLVLKTIELKNNKLRELGLKIPKPYLYDDDNVVMYLYSFIWPLSLPTTAFHYYCLIPIIEYIENWGEGDD